MATDLQLFALGLDHCTMPIDSIGDEGYAVHVGREHGSSELALYRNGEFYPIRSGLTLQSRAVLGVDGILVYGANNRSFDLEEFVLLDAEGKPRCRENTQGFLQRVQPSTGELWFHGLFDGRAVYQHNVGSWNQVYAFLPCAPVTPLESCATHEWLETEGGPVCLSPRSFRLLGSPLSGNRLSPFDKGYSATRNGILRILRESAHSILLRWVGTGSGATWTAHIELPLPLEQVVRAAGNAEGAAIWLSSDSKTGLAHLVIVTRRGEQRRFVFGIEANDFLGVAASGRGWAATVPTSRPSGSTNGGNSRSCSLAVGTFEKYRPPPKTN